MTLRTWAFAIGFLQSSTPVAHALICPEVKYVAVRWQDGRLDRRHVPDALWPSLLQELAMDMAVKPVSKSSMISTVLVGSMGALMSVTFVETHAVEARDAKDVEKALDAATRGVAVTR